MPLHNSLANSGLTVQVENPDGPPIQLPKILPLTVVINMPNGFPQSYGLHAAAQSYLPASGRELYPAFGSPWY